MHLPDKGLERGQIIDVLKKFRADDVKWRDGKLFGAAFHVNDEMEEVVGEAVQMFMWDNVLDPRDLPSFLHMEKDVMSIAAQQAGGDENVVGSFTSGGTESVLLAVKTARDWARANKPEIEHPEIVLPITAHACFHKAAHYFGIKKVITPVDPETCQADVKAIEEAITPNTIMLMGSAPSYAHGVIDPIEEIAALAKERGILCHVDGCVGGFLLPFFREAGADIPPYDFSVEGVTSMSMDFHKYAFAVKGSSMVLYKDPALRMHQLFTCSGWTGYTIINATIQSSKSAGPVAGTWAALQYMGKEGYQDIAKKLYDATQQAIASINAIDGLRVMGKPEMSLLAFTSEELNLFLLSDALKERGWSVQPQHKKGDIPESIHLTINPPNLPRMDAFMADLQAAIEEIRSAPKISEPDLLEGLTAMPADMEIGPEQIEGMFAMLGLSSDAFPSRMAVINEILNVLPTPLADKLLTYYFNEITRYSR